MADSGNLSDSRSSSATPPPDADELEAALAALERGEPDKKGPPGAGQILVDPLRATAPDSDETPAPAPEKPLLVLTQEELDAVLAGGASDEALNEVSLDDLLQPNAAGQDPAERALLDHAEPDAISVTPISGPPPDSTVLQDDLASLFADSAKKPSAAEAGGTEASRATDDVGVSQDLLDALLADAEGAKRSQTAATKPAPIATSAPAPVSSAEAAAATAVESRPRRRFIARVFASLAAAVLVGSGTYLYLSNNLLRPADDSGGHVSRLRPLDHAVRVANALIEEGEYAKAMAELEMPLENARPSQERTGAEYVYVEAAVKNLTSDAPAVAIDTLHDRIDALVAGSRAHPRAAEALVWKAHLYEKQNIPIAAKAVYRDIIRNYGLAPNVDDVLYDASANALALEDYETAGGYLQRLLSEHSGSPLAGPSKLLLGDVYNSAGQRDSARVIYIQVAEAHATTPLGGEAYARLGTLAFDEGRYNDAISQLETRRQMATTLDGNEQVYLVLAKAYRAAGNLAEAEVVLRELIDFFPENMYTPDAYVELSQILEARGLRQEALRLARRTALTYPRNPAALRNKGTLVGNAGYLVEAAEALLAAEAAGAADPRLLLEAGEHYANAQEHTRAAAAYEQLMVSYPTRPEAVEGGIALARLEFEQNRITKALDRLEGLAAIAQGRPQRTPVLTTLAELYSGLGMDHRAGQIYGQVAALTTDPDLLAQSATALLRIGAFEEGMRVAERVDREKLDPYLAYDLLMEHGRTLLRIDPERGLGLMEEAYANYPDAHRPEWGQRLLEAYLTSDRSAYARRLVMDLDVKARQDPAQIPQLIRAAIVWGDYLYDRQDYRAAADAYALVPQDQAARFPDAEWAMFQRANALLQVSDFEGSILLFDALAAGKGAWAGEAATKAKYARLEQRLRGMPVTPLGGTMPDGAAA